MQVQQLPKNLLSGQLMSDETRLKGSTVHGKDLFMSIRLYLFPPSLVVIEYSLKTVKGCYCLLIYANRISKSFWLANWSLGHKRSSQVAL